MLNKVVSWKNLKMVFNNLLLAKIFGHFKGLKKELICYSMGVREVVLSSSSALRNTGYQM